MTASLAIQSNIGFWSRRLICFPRPGRARSDNARRRVRTVWRREDGSEDPPLQIRRGGAGGGVLHYAVDRVAGE